MSGMANPNNPSATDSRKPTWLGSRLRMLSRMGGALGLVLVGLAFATARPEGTLAESAREAWRGLLRRR